jgi:hypothetical protein
MLLAAEHEAAELLRRTRLNAHAPQHRRYSFRWLFELLAWRVKPKNSTPTNSNAPSQTPQVSRDAIRAAPSSKSQTKVKVQAASG